MKSYCSFCCFFKEDTVLRNHPQLLKQGLEVHVELCDVCYEGLKNRKTSMQEWMNEQVQLEFTPNGPQQKLDDKMGVLITRITHCTLLKPQFIVKQLLQRGYVQGILQAYAFGDSSHSLREWREVQFKIDNVTKQYMFIDTEFSQIETCKRFMLLNEKGYIQ